jgi:site-specific DNA-methyltransferase (adenine-specific)
MVNYLLKPNGAFITTASQPFTSALVMSNPKMFKYEWIWDKVQPSGQMTAKYMPMKLHENICVFYNEKPTYNRQFTERKAQDIRVNTVRNKNNQKNKTAHAHLGGADNKYAEDYNPFLVNPKSIITYSKQPDRKAFLHPTQKPIALFEYLLKTYSNEGMTIFDPCMGSGTTGIACKNLNRNFIGIEKDEAYFKIAEQRIMHGRCFLKLVHNDD